MKKLFTILLSIFTLFLATGCDPISDAPIDNPEEPANPIVHTWYDTDTTYPFVYTFTEDKKVTISGNLEFFGTITFTAEGTYSFTDAAQMNVHIDISSGTLNDSEIGTEEINTYFSLIGLSSIMDFVIDHYEDNKMYVTIAELGDRILEYIPEYCGTWNVFNFSSVAAGLIWWPSSSSSDKSDYITLNKDKTFKMEFAHNQAKVIGTYTMSDGKIEFNLQKGGQSRLDDDDLGDPEFYKQYLNIYDYHFGKNFGVLSYCDEFRNNFIVFQKENAEEEVFTAPAKNKDLVGRYVAMSNSGSTWVTYTYVFRADNTYTATNEYVSTAMNGLKYTLTVSGSYSVSDGSLSLKPDASKTEFDTNSTFENPPVPAEPSSVNVTYKIQTSDSIMKIDELNKVFYKF